MDTENIMIIYSWCTLLFAAVVCVNGIKFNGTSYVLIRKTQNEQKKKEKKKTRKVIEFQIANCFIVFSSITVNKEEYCGFYDNLFDKCDIKISLSLLLCLVLWVIIYSLICMGCMDYRRNFMYWTALFDTDKYWIDIT